MKQFFLICSNLTPTLKTNIVLNVMRYVKDENQVGESEESKDGQLHTNTQDIAIGG